MSTVNITRGLFPEDINFIDNSQELTAVYKTSDNGEQIQVGVKKDFQFLESNKKRSKVTVYDEAVIGSIDKINFARKAGNKMNFVICRELSKLANKETLDSLGFKSISQLGKSLFGFQPATSTAYARIGRFFINDNYNIASEVLPEDLATGHLLEFLKLWDAERFDSETAFLEYIEGLYMDGTIPQLISTKNLRKLLKELDEKDIVDSTATEIDESSEKESSESSEKESSESSEKESPDIIVGKVMSSLDSLIATDAFGEEASDKMVEFMEFLESLI